MWGAFVLRAAFIAVGITLLQRLQWVTWVFGAVPFVCSMAAGAQRFAARGDSRVDHEAAAGEGIAVPVIVAVEITDLLFATDSIPAVLSVTHNPFVAYTSNVAAILGLRSLYFALAGMLDKFRYLHYRAGRDSGFAALKMLAARWVEVPATVSLAVIGGVLAACAIFSALASHEKRPAS